MFSWMFIPKKIWYLKFQCISSVFIHPKMHLLPFSPRGGCANFRWRTTDLFSGRKTDWKWIKSKWIRLEIAQWSHKRHVIFSLKASTSASQKKPGKMKPEMYPKSENSEMCNLITLQESEKKNVSGTCLKASEIFSIHQWPPSSSVWPHWPLVGCQQELWDLLFCNTLYAHMEVS